VGFLKAVYYGDMNREEFHKKIGQNIRKARKKAGLSISKAAKAYGCTPKRWVLLEVGNPMSVESFIRAAAVVGVEPWKLMKIS
jgi:transcriptional regulator with XRE-family HTH domain